LTTWGTTLPTRRRGDWWMTVQDWAGRGVTSELQARLARASSRLALVAEQIAALDAQQSRPCGRPRRRVRRAVWCS